MHGFSGRTEGPASPVADDDARYTGVRASGSDNTPAHQRKSFRVKSLVGASAVVCPCIAVMGWFQQRVIGLVRRRAGLPMTCVEITMCLNAVEGSPMVGRGADHGAAERCHWDEHGR
jgi:hypothetical protein